MEIIAYHGWGFGADFWNPWLKIIPDNITFKTAGRGYFFEEKKPRFSSSEKMKVLFLHSYGLHWCPPKQIKSAQCIVIFNSFRTFHPEEETERKRSEKLLENMIQAFKKEPKEVLQKFWENTFYPFENSYSINTEIDTELLLRDLQELNTSQFDPDHITEGKPIISIDSGKDKILGSPRGKEFTELTKRDVVYHFINEGGHALPVTHTADCWSFINAMIPIFRDNGNYRK